MKANSRDDRARIATCRLRTLTDRLLKGLVYVDNGTSACFRRRARSKLRAVPTTSII